MLRLTPPERTISARARDFDELLTQLKTLVRVVHERLSTFALGMRCGLENTPESLARVAVVANEISSLRSGVHDAVCRFIGLRSPVGEDLRTAVSALEVAAEAESFAISLQDVARLVEKLTPVQRDILRRHDLTATFLAACAVHAGEALERLDHKTQPQRAAANPSRSVDPLDALKRLARAYCDAACAHATETVASGGLSVTDVVQVSLVCSELKIVACDLGVMLRSLSVIASNVNLNSQAASPLRAVSL